MQGSDLTNRLGAVLVKFRQEEVALIADIEAMFYQVSGAPEHSDALIFLWGE